MAIGDAYRVTAVFTDGTTGKEQTTGFHVEQRVAVMASIATVGDNVKSWWNDDNAGAGSAEKSRHPNDVALTRVELQRVYPLEPVVQLYQTGLPITGADATDPLPASSAVLCSLRTANVGKRYMGRMYLPRISEDHCDTSGGLTVGDAQLCGDQLEWLRGAMDADDVRMAVFSREDLTFVKKNGDPAPRVGNLVTPVTMVEVDRRLRVIRKRALRTPVYVIGV